MLFFILSGFVVYHATFSHGRAFEIGRYALRRIRRIYPIFLFALLFSYLLGSLQLHRWAAVNVTQLGGNLLMLQDEAALKPGVWVTPFADSPLWSLSYEWWFYVLFVPVVVLLARRPPVQRYVVFLASLTATTAYLAHPNQPSLFVAYLFIWWTGVEFAREYVGTGSITFRHQWPTLAMLGALTVVWAFNLALWRFHGQPVHLGTYPVLPVRHFGMSVVSATIGLAWYRLGFPLFSSTLGFFSILAPISYAVYVLHYPLLGAVGAAVSQRPLVLLISLILLLPLAYVLECLAQPRLNRLLERIFRARHTPVLEQPALISPGP